VEALHDRASRRATPHVCALAFLAVSACMAHDDDGFCTVAGCKTTTRIDVVSVAEESTLIDASLEVCAGTVCARGSVHENTRLVDVAAVVEYRSTPDTLILGLAVGTRPGAETGDVYTVTVRLPDDRVLAMSSWTATYIHLYPNGPRCDVCIEPQLERRQSEIFR